MEALARDSAAYNDLSLWARRSLLAAQKGVERAALRHKQQGIPMVVADQYGAVGEIAPEDIVVGDAILNAPYPEV